MVDEVKTEAPVIPTEESALINAIAEPKLWAGKYKTPEQLEEAYRNSAKVFNENRELQAKLQEITSIPSEYQVPPDVVLRDSELKEIQSISKNAGLTQHQFEKTAREMQSRIRSNLESFERAKQEIPQETMIILQEHVKKTYPEKLQQVILNQLIKDKDAMSDALKDRDARLNSQAPGMNSASTSIKQRYDGEKELSQAAVEYRKSPTATNKARYIDLARQVGESRFSEKIRQNRS
jgi:hypothetical protein